MYDCVFPLAEGVHSETKTVDEGRYIVCRYTYAGPIHMHHKFTVEMGLVIQCFPRIKKKGGGDLDSCLCIFEGILSFDVYTWKEEGGCTPLPPLGETLVILKAVTNM